jgi:Domain of unknown function (DUF4157)
MEWVVIGGRAVASLGSDTRKIAAAEVRRPGTRLEPTTRRRLESRFGRDLDHVRVHADSSAADAAEALGASAFSLGNHIVFGGGRFTSESDDGSRLLAHEVAHVVQAPSGSPSARAIGRPNSDAERHAHSASDQPAGTTSRSAPVTAGTVQRLVEVRPPGRGEASAFDRRQELIDRMNAQSTAVTYRLDGRTIRYDVHDPAGLNSFDRRMTPIIDRAEVIPMRLITAAGRVAGSVVSTDVLQEGYVDLDDLLSSSDLGFQLLMIHVLTERVNVADYERRIGTPGVGAEWARVHPIARRAEAAHLAEVIGDPSITYVYDEERPSGAYVSGFRSRSERYWVFQVYSTNRTPSGIEGSSVFVQMPDGRRLTIEQLRAERARAAAAGR